MHNESILHAYLKTLNLTVPSILIILHHASRFNQKAGLFEIKGRNSDVSLFSPQASYPLSLFCAPLPEFREEDADNEMLAEDKESSPDK